MADNALRLIASNINTATQVIRHELKRAAQEPANESLPRMALHIADALDPEGAAQNKSTQAPLAQGAILRPIALGLKAGAVAGHLYGQGAKYLVGRGERLQADGRTEAPVTFALHGPEAEKAERHARNMQALKQDGVLGLAVHAMAQGVGNIVGAAFCGGQEEADKLAERITQGTQVFNAGARSLLLGAPMVAAVITGTLVGLTAGAAVAGYKGLQAVHAHYSAASVYTKREPAGEEEAMQACDEPASANPHAASSAEKADAEKARGASGTIAPNAPEEPKIYDTVRTLYQYADRLCDQEENGTPLSDEQKQLLFSRFSEALAALPDRLPKSLYIQFKVVADYVTALQANKTPGEASDAV